MLFYTQLFTSKRGSLAKIWLAAHWERKLTKAHVFECNLEATIRDIISPKMKMGLRTSGHLLLGVVRIYSRKAKYLLIDCNDALLKIKLAFRPGQTDLPEEGLEATVTAITLSEDFSAFDTQLPSLSDIDVVDHFSLNQSRLEDITLKEDFGTGSLNFPEMRAECQGPQSTLLDMNFHSLVQDGDAFGDEDQVYDLFDTNRGDRIWFETPTLSETTLLVNGEEAFALEPVTNSLSSEKKRGKRKRKLVVDQTKELNNECIKKQLSDYSDLITPLDIAPPTVQLMQWKEHGAADKLLTQPSSTIAAPQINELFVKSVFQVKHFVAAEELEEMRQDGQEASLSELYSSFSKLQSMLGSQDFQERRINRRAQKLLSALKSQSNRETRFALKALCEGCTRSQAAATFFCLLVLKKQQALYLYQSAPYEDIIIIIPGPTFYDQ
ncbi:double-strand-break repair protein rad21-like protein 1 [Echeneis naucrates]|uniref:double-strand-break repair protein rad21-like protein 1 n=1 Tax=Echeneis naucrates TaxID=173247 RepID=UPI0011134E2A|nr:double-strand-break repair protein rad21 homolog A-like [Echeneis naucrates]